MKRKTIKKFTCIFLATVAIFYVLYHIYVLIFPSIKTETAYITQAFDFIDSNAYIIREELEIPTEARGYVKFVLNDADKVAKNGVVAQVYATEQQGILRKKADIIKNEIKRLENLNKYNVALSTTPSSIEQQAYVELNGLIKNVNNNELEYLPKCKDKILYILNERQLATGQSMDVSDKIEAFKEELTQINTDIDKATEMILAEKAGYFVGKTDGYEQSFDYADVKKITTEQVELLLSNNVNHVNNKAAKLVTDSNWYVVCSLNKDDVLRMATDQYVTLTMPLVSSDKLKAKIVVINQNDKTSSAAVVFQCDDIDETTLTIRKEPIKINIAEYKGVAVSKKAIHEKKMTLKVLDDKTGKEKVEEKIVKGVYVLSGKQLIFKEIDILFYANDYVICNPNPEKSKLFSDTTIKEYDEIVTKGRDLYDGKFI